MRTPLTVRIFQSMPRGGWIALALFALVAWVAVPAAHLLLPPDHALHVSAYVVTLIGKILCYAQGFEMIAAASEQFGWSLDLPTIARTWRAGCIIRSAMLDDMATALSEASSRNLMFADFFTRKIQDSHADLRQVVCAGAAHGIALPALGAGLSYFDAMRTARGTADMIQGQRDYFGLHGFERFDGRKDQHGPWAG